MITATTLRTCRSCHRTLPVDRFYASGHGNGRRTTCRDCLVEADARRRRQRNARVRHPRYNARGEVWCNHCQRYLPADTFKRHPNRPNTYWSYCKPCTRVIDRERYARRTSTLEGAERELAKKYARKERKRRKDDQDRTRFIQDTIRMLIDRGLTRAEIARLAQVSHGSLIRWLQRPVKYTPGRRPITANVEHRFAILARAAIEVLPPPGKATVLKYRRIPHPDLPQLMAMCEPAIERYPVRNSWRYGARDHERKGAKVSPIHNQESEAA